MNGYKFSAAKKKEMSSAIGNFEEISKHERSYGFLTDQHNR